MALHSHSNTMAKLCFCNSIFDDKVSKMFGTCHSNTAVISCAKFYNDYFITNLDRCKTEFPLKLSYDANIVSEIRPLASITLRSFPCCSFWLEATFCSYSIPGSQITTYYPHATTTQLLWHTKFCLDKYFMSWIIWIWAKWNFHQIWITANI